MKYIVVRNNAVHSFNSFVKLSISIIKINIYSSIYKYGKERRKGKKKDITNQGFKRAFFIKKKKKGERGAISSGLFYPVESRFHDLLELVRSCFVYAT